VVAPAVMLTPLLQQMIDFPPFDFFWEHNGVLTDIVSILVVRR
jgi:hypothetical protein